MFSIPDKLVKEAELNAGEDKKRKELTEACNIADSLIYQTEKSLKEIGDKIDAQTKSEIEGIISKLKEAMNGNDIEQIKKLSDELTQASHKLAETVYKQSAEAGQQTPGADASDFEQHQDQNKETKNSDEDIVDADFEEVKDSKK